MDVLDPAGFGVHVSDDAVGVATRYVALLLELQDAGMELVGVPVAYDDKVISHCSELSSFRLSEHGKSAIVLHRHP